MKEKTTHLHGQEKTTHLQEIQDKTTHLNLDTIQPGGPSLGDNRDGAPSSDAATDSGDDAPPSRPSAVLTRLAPVHARNQTDIAADPAHYRTAIATLENQGIDLRMFFRELKKPQLVHGPIPLYSDASAALDGTHRRRVSRESKWVCINLALVRQALEDGVITTVKCPTENNLADVLTKPLTGPAFMRAQRALQGPPPT